MQTIYLDISNKGVIPTVYAKQNDVGRKFAVILTDSGLPYIPVSGSAFSVWYKGASGEGNYTDIGDKSAFSVNGNKVIVEMITQMLSNDGEGILSLALNDIIGNQIGLWSIRYVCESVPGAGSEGAKEYYTAFSESVKKLSDAETILKSKLSVDGSNAMEANLPMGGHRVTGLGDPQEDGDALPLGYANGHFAPAVESAEHPGCYYRTVNGAVEWLNPPMEPNKEYRTTKRHNGKAIYTKLITYSPSSFTEQLLRLSHGISNLDIGLSINVTWLRNGTEWRHLPAAYHADTKWTGQAYWYGLSSITFELGEYLLTNMQGSVKEILVTTEYTKTT